MPTDQLEGVGDGAAQPFGQHALGLFDDDPAVQRGLQLFTAAVGFAQDVAMPQADGRGIGEEPAPPHVLGAQGAVLVVEDQGPEDAVLADEGKGGDGGEARVEDAAGEPRSPDAAVRSEHREVGQRSAAADSVEAGALLQLHLATLQLDGDLVGSRQVAGAAGAVRANATGRFHTGDMRCAAGQATQEITIVLPVVRGGGQGEECFGCLVFMNRECHRSIHRVRVDRQESAPEGTAS